MARRKQEIKIVVHTPSNTSSAFCAKNIEDFWIEKMSAKIKESGLTKKKLQCLFESEVTRECGKGIQARHDKRMRK